MEIQGIRVDKERLVEMGVEFEARLKEIEQENLCTCWGRV